MAGRSINKVILVGNLGSDPELKSIASGKMVSTFSVATNESWTGKDQQQEQRTEWHRIVAWGQLAEICGEYLKKGQQVYIEGRIQTRSWEDQNGQTQKTTEIVAREMLMLGSREGGQASNTERKTEGESAEVSGDAGDDLPF